MGIAYDNAGTIINTAAVECGLAPVSDPYASTDPNFVQLQYFLTSCGRELKDVRRWTKLQKTYAFQTGAGIGNYPLPGDFRSVVPNTSWNRTKRLPVGTLTAQDMEFLKGRVVGILFTIMQRMLQGQFYIYPDTNAPGSEIVAYEYMSRFWVVPTGTAGPFDGNFNWMPGVAYSGGNLVDSGGSVFSANGNGTSGTFNPQGTGGSASDGLLTWAYQAPSGADAPAKSADLVLLDSPMMSKRLRLMWLAAKGFPTDAAQEEFERARDAAMDADTVQRALYITGNYVSPPVLDRRNIPETGFGL